MRLEGTSAIITGGAGGLGEATVRRLAAGGVGVVIADLADDRATKLAADLGDRVRYVRTDVTSEESVLAALEVARDLGPLRTAVAAHGGEASGGRLVNRDGEPLPLEGFRRTLEVYLTGTFNLMRLAASEMVKSEPDDNGCRGVLISTASIAAYEGQIGQIPYAAAKGGVVSMTLVAARDLAPSGVRSMTIAPGTFFTPAFMMAEDEANARFGTGIQFPRRMGRADEYAALVQTIVENDYLNGEVIRLDAGLRFQPK